MNFKRIGRTFGCLLLVCCLVFNIATIPARAIAAEYVLIPAAIVATAMLIGLGPQPGDVVDDFNMAIHGFTQFLADSTEYVTDGLVNVWRDVTGKYYVEESLIDTLRNWLFDSGVVYSCAVPIPSVNPDGFESAYKAAAAAPYAIMVQNVGTTGEWTIAYSDVPLSHSISSGYSTGNIYYSSDVTYFAIYKSSVGEYVVETSFSEPYRYTASVNKPVVVTNFGTNEEVTTTVLTSQDLILNSLVDPSVSLATGYADWAAGAISIPGVGASEDVAEEDKIRVYPLGMGQTTEETIGMSQTDVQTGTGTYTDTATDTEVITGTFADTAVGTFINSLIDALVASFTEVIVEPILAGIKAIFVPSEDYITAKVEALAANYAFVESMVAAGDTMQVLLGSLEPRIPIIYIDLGATEGSYNLGGKVPFVDLTWYARYKPTADAIIAAFMWLWFIWRTIVILPGTISGESGLIGSDSVGYFHGYRSSTDRIIYSGPGTSLARRD